MNDEPVGFDGFGSPLFEWQVGERLDDDTRRRLLDAIDNQRA